MTFAHCISANRVVTLLGSPIAGESYTLEYSTDDPLAVFEWLGPPDGRTPIISGSSLVIISNSSSSQLQFRPLQQSHSGSYSCRATTHEGTVFSTLEEIRVNGTHLISSINNLKRSML